MTKRISLQVALVVATACNVIFCSPTTTISTESQPHTTQFKASSLFDDKAFRQRFNKNYDSLLEETTRKIYFMANAYKVCVAGVAYRLWKQSSYLALNHLSDWSPKELEMMENKMLALDSHFDVGVEPSDGRHAHHQVDNVTSLETELEREIEKRLDQSQIFEALAEQQAARRKKRQVAQGDQWNPKAKRRPRPLPMDKLLQRGEILLEPAEVLAKVDSNPEQNNPNYDPFVVERDTMGLGDEQEEVTMWTVSGPEEGASSCLISSMMQNADSYLKVVTDQVVGGPTSSQQPDEMFLDLRQSNCMFLPRKQGKCGACYAFAAITMAEFYYCKQRDRLNAFSEQYLIDCGKSYVEGMEGCKGSWPGSVPKFIHNFGLELEGHLPYLERESQCPLRQDTELSETGFIRMKMGNFAAIHSFHWPDRLQHGPLMVQVATPADFYQYAGGIEQGEKCRERPSHAMLIVGHGREDGQEFWLIRNSYGTSWGEEGYWKLAKSAPERCLYKQMAFAYGTTDGQQFNMRPRLNLQHHKTIELLNRET